MKIILYSVYSKVPYLLYLRYLSIPTLGDFLPTLILLAYLYLPITYYLLPTYYTKFLPQVLHATYLHVCA